MLSDARLPFSTAPLGASTDMSRKGMYGSRNHTPERSQRTADLAVLQDVLQGKRVERITFTEVTQKAVERALANPRQIDSNLVDAYRARRALDYLLGYNLSPILWRKLGGAKSAGTYPHSTATMIHPVALVFVSEHGTDVCQQCIPCTGCLS